jgi:hypothetical protein
MEVCCPLRVVLNNSWAWHPHVVWKKGVKSDFHDTLRSSSTILSCSQRLCCDFLCSSVITIVQFWRTFYEKISKWESLYYNTIGRFLRDCQWGGTHSGRDLLNFSAHVWYFFQNTLKILIVSLYPSLCKSHAMIDVSVINQIHRDCNLGLGLVLIQTPNGPVSSSGLTWSTTHSIKRNRMEECRVSHIHQLLLSNLLAKGRLGMKGRPWSCLRGHPQFLPSHCIISKKDPMAMLFPNHS